MNDWRGRELFLEFVEMPYTDADSLCGPWFAYLTIGLPVSEVERSGRVLPSVCSYARQWLDIPWPLEAHCLELEEDLHVEEGCGGLLPFWERAPHPLSQLF